MAYQIIILIHSWLRWVILSLLLAALIKSSWGWVKKMPFTGSDRVLQIALTAWVDLQVVVGLTLYWLSPLTPKTGEQMAAVMHVPSMRFFAVEHQVPMILALVATHVASVSSRRVADSELPRKHQRWAVGLAIALALIVLGIPWPGLVYGRPLFHL